MKADVASKETLAKKESALRNELKSKKYSDDAVKLILSKGGYTDKIELDKMGKQLTLILFLKVSIQILQCSLQRKQLYAQSLIPLR